jgi:hypothetical protein
MRHQRGRNAVSFRGLSRRQRVLIVARGERVPVANLVANPGIPGDPGGPKFAEYQQVAESTGVDRGSSPSHSTTNLNEISHLQNFNFAYWQITGKFWGPEGAQEPAAHEDARLRAGTVSEPTAGPNRSRAALPPRC